VADDGRLQQALGRAAARAAEILGQPEARVGAAGRLVLPDGRVCEGAVRADETHFPASLVKLFHAVAFLRAVAEGRLVENAEDSRALEALLRLSSNAADQYLLRRLCPPPPEAEAVPAPAFMAAREGLTEAWLALDPVAYRGLRVSNATIVDGPFGIEALAREALGRNRVTARAVLAVMRAIAGEGGLLSPVDAARLQGWMDRTWARPPCPAAGTAGQVDGFLTRAMPADAAVWSKGGWTEETRHDAVHARFAGGSRLLLVVLVSGRDLWHRDDVLPAFGAEVLAGLDLGERR
jgi:hypothetical protein